MFDGEKVPEANLLKSRFDEKLQQFGEVKRKVEREMQRLKAEISIKKDHRKSVMQDLAGKEVNDSTTFHWKDVRSSSKNSHCSNLKNYPRKIYSSIFK